MNDHRTSNNGHAAPNERGLSERLLDTVKVGILAVDGDLVIVYRNHTATCIVGRAERLDACLEACTGDSQWSRRLIARMAEGTASPVGTFECGQRTFEVEIIPIAARADGARAVVILSDCTDVSVLRGDLQNAQRLAAVGDVAARVVHELNNPLDGIQRYLNLATRAADQGHTDKVCRYIEQARIGLERMARITADMLEISSRQNPINGSSNLRDIVEDACRSMDSRAQRAGVTWVCRVHECVLPEASSSLLFQVFCNLAKNAVEAMSENGGTLRVHSVVTSETTAVLFEDDGHGLPADPESVFVPYYSTKREPGDAQHASGSGLGLSICRELLERCGGAISARPRDGGGAVFEVRLPTTKSTTSCPESVNV